MSDAPEGAAGGDTDAEAGASGVADPDADLDPGETAGDTTEEGDLEALRQQVEEEYDFENFGPQDMADMSPDEWAAAFDEETWITGERLLDRVEADLKSRVASRDVFARVERFDDLLIAYSDNGYAAVYPDGSIEGRGTVLRDAKPTVALCSMDSYDPPEAPEDAVLPQPQEVPESSDALGNTVLQAVAGVQVLAGAALLVAWLLYSLGLLGSPAGPGGLNLWLLVAVGLGFLLIGLLLFGVVANARLSDKYRAEEFRNRLRAVGLEDGERPDFLEEISGLEGELPAELSTLADGEGANADADAGADADADTNSSHGS